MKVLGLALLFFLRYSESFETFSQKEKKEFELLRQDIYNSDGSCYSPITQRQRNSIISLKADLEKEKNANNDGSPLAYQSSLKKRVRRKVLKYSIHGKDEWPANIVPYYIDLSSYRSAASQSRIQEAVLSATKAISEVSCVTFIEKDRLDSYTRALIGHNHYIQIYNGVDCWSNVGCSGCYKNSSTTSYQQLSIAESCISALAVQHELGHALGFTHEHTRTDMHTQITVNYSGIDKPSMFYRKYHPEFVNLAPYDISSIQHYRNDRLLTNDINDMWLKAGIGGLSHYDKWSLNAAHCADNCNLRCENDGYVIRKNGQCMCACPDGLSGAFCENSATVASSSCGGVINLNGNSPAIDITTPNYPSPYSAGIKCTWLVKAPEGKVIRTTGNHVSLPANSNGCIHFVEVRDRLIGQVARQKCGHCVGCISSVSHSNAVIILFDASKTTVGASSGVSLSLMMQEGCQKCRGAPCENGICYYKSSYMRCGFESGLVNDCSDIKIHDSYQKSYKDMSWTEAPWEISVGVPKLKGQGSKGSAQGRLHLQSVRPPVLTPGPYEGVFRIVPYLLHPNEKRCLEFMVYLCCDTQTKLLIHTAASGTLSQEPVLTISEHRDEWAYYKIDVGQNQWDSNNIEVVFISRHAVGRGEVHLGIDDIVWRSGACN